MRLKKADETLKDAGLLAGAGSYFGAVNRLYYAAFYAARALLAVKGLDSPKHSGVIAIFNKEFVKEGIIPKDLGRILNDLFEIRTAGDYEDNKIFSKAEVDDYLIKCGTFIAGVKQALKQQL
ncbi:MAG: HEPN domain-containing protein [Candidatus Saganbacteria bacterium]|nr:HEPN domain-containing protein [Candidatus Saganbacteria bacterium]